jgi:hypothetical protein
MKDERECSVEVSFILHPSSFLLSYSVGATCERAISASPQRFRLG